ncbi:MAG: helix-turn-helix transcriptional regulator [Clostridia bacterium]|nr:helix-turn-helix transcriptional regulator [Clostridia bacterium]
MEFGEKVRKARLAMNLSQKELSEMTGISLRTITNYESGGRKPKTKESYQKLSAALGLEVSELMDDMDDFVIKAQEQYGSRGRRQAEDVVRTFRIAAAGGELDDDDLDFIKEAMMQTYEDAKKYNKRFANKTKKGKSTEGDSN